MSRLLRRGVLIGAAAAAAYAAWRFIAARATAAGGPGYEPQPFPMPPRPVAPAPVASPPAPTGPELANPPEHPGTEATHDGDGRSDAIDPEPDGSCPLAFPIKGKLTTGIYHRPGAFVYDRTRADRCYRDESAAESDGLRAAKR